jgi:hypothetical protein
VSGQKEEAEGGGIRLGEREREGENESYVSLSLSLSVFTYIFRPCMPPLDPSSHPAQPVLAELHF